MSNTELFILAIALSFDSLAVSLSNGMLTPGIRFRQALRIAMSLSFFQALFPLLGWFAGSSLQGHMAHFDHWIAFILLIIIGGKMLIDAIRGKVPEGHTIDGRIGLMALVGISVATSIDAFVVGISFGFIEVRIGLAVMIIGIVTFVASMTGIWLGKRSAGLLGRYANLLGGLILVGIGIHVLLSHTVLA